MDNKKLVLKEQKIFKSIVVKFVDGFIHNSLLTSCNKFNKKDIYFYTICSLILPLISFYIYASFVTLNPTHAIEETCVVDE